MMIFDWYNLFNRTVFEATQLISRQLNVVLETRGDEQILITRGNELGILFKDTFLVVLFNEENPYVRAGDDGTYAVYVDSNDDVWLGIMVSP